MINLNQETISNMLTTATYGNECFGIRREKGAPESSYEYREDIWADDLLKGRSLIGIDFEEGSKKKFNLEDLKNGLERFKEMYPDNYEVVEDESGDMWDFYNLMQVVLYGDIIYG